VQNIYRKVEEARRLPQRGFANFPAVKDPVKAAEQK
jgi:hypothetical protein